MLTRVDESSMNPRERREDTPESGTGGASRAKMSADGKRRGAAFMDPIPQGGQQIPDVWKGKRVTVALSGRGMMGELVEVNDRGVVVIPSKAPRRGGGDGFEAMGVARTEPPPGQYFCPWGQVQFIRYAEEEASP
jgi:hypothetical protein